VRVAPLRTTGQGCLICRLPDRDREAVNAAIWDGTTDRVRGYRAQGQRAYGRATGKDIDPKSVTRHVEHTEADWREATSTVPASGAEVPVFDTSYESIVERAAGLSALAMAKLHDRIAEDRLEDRELVSIARLGVNARTDQEANRVASKRPQIQVAAIIGVAGGTFGELPEHEIIDVTPERELLTNVRAERQTLKELAAREAEQVEAEHELDALFSG